MAKLEVIHCIPSIKDEAKGPSYSVNRLSESINDQKYESQIVSADGVDFSRPGIISFNLGAAPKKVGRSPEMYQWLKTQAQSGQIDLLHCHSLWMMPNIYPAWISKKYNIPLVIAPRGTLAERAFASGSLIKKIFWPLLQHPALASATCFQATAESEYHDIRRMGFKQPIAIISNGIDIPANLPGKVRNSSRRTLLFLGRIHQIKGLDMLMHAWGRIEASFLDWDLKIVGTDAYGYLTEVQKLAAGLALPRVSFAKPVFGEEKWLEYNNAELYILPTYSENFGMSIAEALAVGVPVITTKGAPWSVLESSSAGWWTEVSVEGLVVGLSAALAKSDEELRAIGANGKQLMRTSFSWESIGQQTRELYDWILNGGKVPKFVFLS